MGNCTGMRNKKCKRSDEGATDSYCFWIFQESFWSDLENMMDPWEKNSWFFYFFSTQKRLETSNWLEEIIFLKYPQNIKNIFMKITHIDLKKWYIFVMSFEE